MLRRELPLAERSAVDILTCDLQAHEAARAVGKIVKTIHRYRLLSTCRGPTVRLLRKAQACVKRSHSADWNSLADVFFGVQTLRTMVEHAGAMEGKPTVPGSLLRSPEQD